MTTAREKAIEAMARAICANEGNNPDALDEARPGWSEWKSWTDTAEASLAALSAAGFAVVPKEATDHAVYASLDAASAAAKDKIRNAAHTPAEWAIATVLIGDGLVLKAAINAAVTAADLARQPEKQG